jgi:hypothetical protein
MILKPPKGAIINRRHPIIVGLEAAWLFNEGGGKIVYDSSGNGKHGTIAGASWTGGKFGPALSFNGSSDKVEIPLIKAGSPLTYLVWFNTTSDSAVSVTIGQSKITTDTGDTYSMQLSGTLAGDPLGAAARSISVSWSIAHTTTGFTVGKWHQGVTVFNSPSLRKAYIDSGSMGQNTTDIGDENDQNCAGIGYLNRLTPASYYPGKIDHILVWSRILIQEEIAYLYRNPFCMFEVDL